MGTRRDVASRRSAPSGHVATTTLQRGPFSRCQKVPFLLAISNPRERGGTEGGTRPAPGEEGLSPRARGNLQRMPDDGRIRGSIPASAGEPLLNLQRKDMRRVYPRERGGTRSTLAPDRPPMGLSPRARGNRGDSRSDRHEAGSIPASAGEPRRGRRWRRGNGVYPRERGGTTATVRAWGVSRGLSPRARGNPIPGAAHSLGEGSIPASAGEPLDALEAQAI